MKTEAVTPQKATKNKGQTGKRNAVKSDQETIRELEAKVASLEHQLEWFKQQVFGRKSEKQNHVDPPEQMLISDLLKTDQAPEKTPPRETETITYTRRKRRDDCVTDAGLRFDETVPVKVIRSKVPELEGAHADEYEVIREEHTYRLAQRRASYVILDYVRPVVKRKADNTIFQPRIKPALWEGTLADVSFIAGLLVEKLVYHQPLYRQHQRLLRDGITLSRGTLTHLVHKAITLLEPIYNAQFAHILLSKILAIDETPIKAGREKPGKMRLCWYWPIYGEDDEVAFTFSRTRGHQHLMKILSGYEGIILTDGHGAYNKYVKKVNGVDRAQCWTHARREFIKAQKAEPDAVNEVLDIIGGLYRHETHIREKELEGDAILKWRLTYAKPIVDEFFDWCDAQCQRMDLVPSNPLSKAIQYARSRESELRMYLTDPQLSIDTNHLERTLRVIPMGKKNWLFNWTEIGAERVGIAQSLLTTCRLHVIHPYDYLVDVLQRVDQHPAADVEQLTPRLWKSHFSNNPLTSDLDLV